MWKSYIWRCLFFLPFSVPSWDRFGSLFRVPKFSFFFEKKIIIWGPEKGSQIGPKMAPKKIGKKDTSKSEIFTFFYEFYWIYCILQVIMGLQGRFYCVLQCIHASGRAGKWRPMWPELWENVDFCKFFIVGLENASWRFGAFQGTKFGSKKWFGSNENRKRKKRLVARRLGNSFWAENDTKKGLEGHRPASKGSSFSASWAP